MDNKAMERKLDTLIAILKIAYKGQLDELRDAINADAGRAAILDVSRSDWVSGGTLVKSTKDKAKKSERSIQNYIGELIEGGLLEKRGAGRSVEYRSTGVI